MTDKIFDDFIKNKLKDHSAQVPGDMWERILEKKEPVRPVGFFVPKTLLPIFGLIAITSIIGYVMWQTPAVAPGNQDNKITTEVPASNKNNNSAVKKPGQGLNAVAQTDVSGDKNVKLINPKEKQIAENFIGIATQLPGSKTISVSLLKNQLLSYTTISEKASGDSPGSVAGMPGKNIPQKDAYSLSGFNRSKVNMLSVIAKEETHLNVDETNKKLLNKLHTYQISCLLDCPTARRPARNDWYVEVYGSPDYAIKSIVKNNSIDPNYFRRKDSTETMEGSFSAGVRISKSVSENMLIKTGVQYSQINEKFKYRTENERRLTTVVTIRTIIRAPGDTVRISDTSMIEQIGYREKITHNKYRSIDIPIILSYEWGERWKKSINAGILLNLHAWQQGEMLDTSYIPTSFNKTSGQTFKTNVGVGVYVGFSIIKDIGNKTEVFAEPYFRYNISNMTTDKSLFNQKFNVAGLNLGVRYKLSGNRQRYTGR